MTKGSRLVTAMLSLSIALIATSFVGPMRGAAIYLWAAGLAVMVGAFVVAVRSRPVR